MAKGKKNTTNRSVAMPKQRFTSSTLILVAAVTVAIAFAGIFIGTALDYSVDTNGSIDFNLISRGFNLVSAHPQWMIKKMQTQESNARTCLFFAMVAWGIFLLYKYSEEPKRLHRKGVEHGSAHWADKKEKEELVEKKDNTERIIMRDKKGKPLLDEKGNMITATAEKAMILSNDVKVSLNTRLHMLNLNVLIIGGAGSGKTRFVAKPNIMQLSTSYVITDPKGEILQSTGVMLEQAGYKVRVLNLIEMNHSNNYNPFHYVYDNEGNVSEDNIKKMVDCLFKNTKGDGEKTDFWAQKGQSLLEAIVFLLFEESEYNAEFEEVEENGIKIRRIKPESRDLSHLNFFSVTEKMRRLNYPPKGSKNPDGFFMERNPDESEEEFRERQSKGFLCSLDKDFIELEKRKGDTLAGRLYKEVRNAPEETGQSFLSSANVKTFFFNLTNLRNLTCCDNIHLETIGDEKTALFLLVPATSGTYNFVAAMMYTQMFDVLSNRANFKFGGTLPVHVRCIMDEFYNIGEIPDFDKVIGFVRSMGISLNVILQNMSQIKARYEKTWENITGNCSSMLFLGGNEQSTLEYISKLLGKETIDVKSLNQTKGGKSSSSSTNNSIMGRELMTQDEIKTMPNSDCLALLQFHNPFYCEKYHIEEHPNYKFLADGGNEEFNVSEIRSVTVQEFEAQFNKTSVSVSLAKNEIEKVDTNINLEKNEKEKSNSNISLEKEDEKVDTGVNLEKTGEVKADTGLSASYKKQLTTTFVKTSELKNEEKIENGVEDIYSDEDDDVFRDNLINEFDNQNEAVAEEFTDDTRFGEVTDDFESFEFEEDEEKEESYDVEDKTISTSLEEERFSDEVTDEKEEVSLENEEFGIELVMTSSDSDYSDFGDLAFL